jgi:phosphopantetheine adenylyltransferase/dephospho-CoA kinase
MIEEMSSNGLFKSGLMLLSCIPQINKLSSYLRAANETITSTLYISIEPNLLSSSQINTNTNSNQNQELLKLLPQIYAEANRSTPYLDVRVLHQNYYHKQTNPFNRCLQYTPQIVLINGSNISEDIIRKYLITRFNIKDVQKIQSINERDNDFGNNRMSNKDVQKIKTINGRDNDLKNFGNKVYNKVCLGGTFDNLHNGHKVLLSTAQLRCDQSVTIGVTDAHMIQTKKLWELIEPIDIRIEKLRQFVTDVDPFIEYNIVSISDPYGPAITDEDLECIVVSEETIKGGQKINEIRAQRNMKPLDIIIVELLSEYNKESDLEEMKISSSSLRMRKLGSILKEPQTNDLPKKPYIIGLTGGIASGKSSIAEKLKSLGAGVINCDKIAHQTYRSTQSAVYQEIVKEFGSDILKSDSSIDRKKLGSIVFADPEKLKLLNSIVWPKLEPQIHEEIDKMKIKHEVIVLEIALLLEAKWDNKVHQVWVTIIDETEAIVRLKDRNDLTEEEAKLRIKSQLTNSERVMKANVVFSTKWEQSFTMDQVKKAWDHLQRYLDQN